MNFAMPQEVPPCGRFGCRMLEKHSHRDWQTGDRVVVEPKLATAPGWAYANPRGTIVADAHLKGMCEVVTVALDNGGPADCDWRLLTRERTFNQREYRRSRRRPAEKERKGALDPAVCAEPTLDDYLGARRP